MRAGGTRTAQLAAVSLGALLGALALLGAGRPAAAVEEAPMELQGVGVDEQLGVFVDRGLAFTDHDGNPVRLGDYFDDGKPVMLTLNYYTCTALCSLHLNGLTEALRSFDWKPGDEFRIVTVSINPEESAELARGKRANYLKALEKGEDVDWSFLTAATGPGGRRSDANVRALAASVGFGYRYDAESQQYAHAAVTLFLSPEGKVARYLYGIDVSPRDLKFALMEAAEGRVGSTFDKILLTCFHYDAIEGRYGAYAFGIMRLGAALTLAALGLLLLLMWRRERARRSAGRAPGGRPPSALSPVGSGGLDVTVAHQTAQDLTPGSNR